MACWISRRKFNETYFKKISANVYNFTFLSLLAARNLLGRVLALDVPIQAAALLHLEVAIGALLPLNANVVFASLERRGLGLHYVLVAELAVHSANQTEADKEKGRASGQDWFRAKPPPTGKEMLQDVMRLWGQKRAGGKEGEKEDEAQLPGSVF